MAIASINSRGGWNSGDLEGILTDLKTWEANERSSITNNSTALLYAVINTDTTGWIAHSTTDATWSGNGYTASIHGSNFGKLNSQKVTSVSIADSVNRSLELKGLITSKTFKINYLHYEGDGYSETDVGSIYPISSKPQILKSWSTTIPLDSGDLTIDATGTKTIYSATNVTTTYKTIKLSYGSTSYSVTGLKTTTFGDPLDIDYVALVHSFFSGNDKFTGSSNNDEMNAYDGNDILDGGSGSDTLNGGLGKDKLTGGLGSDMFVFSDALNGKTNVDTIVDFMTGTDRIQLFQIIFSNILGVNNSFDANDILKGSWKKTIDNSSSDAHLIFNSANHALYYDADANGSGLAVQFATLTGVTSINANDFMIVGLVG